MEKHRADAAHEIRQVGRDIAIDIARVKIVEDKTIIACQSNCLYSEANGCLRTDNQQHLQARRPQRRGAKRHEPMDCHNVAVVIALVQRIDSDDDLVTQGQG